MRRVLVAGLAFVLATGPAAATKGGGTSAHTTTTHTVTTHTPTAPKAAALKTPSGGGGSGVKVTMPAPLKVPGPPASLTAQGVTATTSNPIPQAAPTYAVNPGALISGQAWQKLAPSVGLPPAPAAPSLPATAGTTTGGATGGFGLGRSAVPSPTFAAGDTSGVRGQSNMSGGPPNQIVPGPMSGGSMNAHPFMPDLSSVKKLAPPPGTATKAPAAVVPPAPPASTPQAEASPKSPTVPAPRAAHDSEMSI
jgi:hypothetical protein